MLDSSDTGDESALTVRPEPLRPNEGWGVLHLFYRATAHLDRRAVLAAVAVARDNGCQVVSAALLGHKADLGIVALGDDLWTLRELQTAIASAGLDLVSSYVSLTEISEYAAGIPPEMKQARIFPELPPEGMPAFCFYPMSKRRASSDNWYMLDFDERKELMMGHGKVGRLFHGRVLQVITGSTGIDDWEWGVTLFAVHPDDLKDCVYQMRFDEASARYAEFGPFYTGMVADLEAVIAKVTSDSPTLNSGARHGAL